MDFTAHRQYAFLPLSWRVWETWEVLQTPPFEFLVRISKKNESEFIKPHQQCKLVGIAFVK